MLENLKKEMNNFFKDLDENIKDKEELLYVKQKTDNGLYITKDAGVFIAY